MQESYFESMDIDEMNLYDTGLVYLFLTLKRNKYMYFIKHKMLSNIFCVSYQLVKSYNQRIVSKNK